MGDVNKVQRFNVIGYKDPNGCFVGASDFDAERLRADTAIAEASGCRAANGVLRDELATTRAAAKEELDGVRHTRRKFRQERDQLQQRLADAERRNATLVKAATEFMEYAESGWDHFPDVGVNLRAALAKPTESGASE